MAMRIVAEEPAQPPLYIMRGCINGEAAITDTGTSAFDTVGSSANAASFLLVFVRVGGGGGGPLAKAVHDAHPRHRM